MLGLSPPFIRNHLGRRSHDPTVVAYCCIQKVLFCHTYDSIESSIKTNAAAIGSAFGVDNMPGHSVIQRGMEKIPLLYFRRVTRKLIWKFRRRGMDIAVDSSGFSISNRSKWFDIRIGRTNSRKECLKLHIAVDVQTGIIHGFKVTNWRKSDIRQFEALMKGLPQVGNVTGDKAYSSRKNCKVVVSKGGKPYLCFKTNATGKAHGSPAWKQSFYEFKENEETWMEVYHLRSIVESVFSSLKKRWNSYILSRKTWMKRKELVLKVLSYNMKQVLYNERAEELGKSLWQEISE